MFLLTVFCASAQIGDEQPGQNQPTTEEQLAGQFYNNGEWEKAAALLEKLYSETSAVYYFRNLLSCYTNLKDFKSAEKLANRQIKKSPKQLSFMVDLGHVYQLAGETNKAEKQFEKALKQMEPFDFNQVKELSNAFEKYKLPELAIKTLLDARNAAPASYRFNTELAKLYSGQGDTDKMMVEYCEIINNQGYLYLEEIQQSLQDIITADASGEKFNIIRERFLREIQRNPDNTIFSDLLIWIFIQKKDFESAFIQAKSLDKRLKENGKRLLELARTAAMNEQYDFAKRAFLYVISICKNEIYIQAKKELSLMLYRRLTTSISYTPEELSELVQLLKGTYAEIGKNESAYAVAIRLGHLLAFYRSQPDSALTLLSPLTEPSSGLTIRPLNEVKLEIADIQLLQGEIWEATLTYAQIEKALKTDTLGQEAKFRNAKLAYYKGDFEWAKAQLDILKAATTKLIANDALELSLLISDNTVYDTTGEALRIFARSDLFFFQNKTDQALLTLDSLARGLPETTLGDDILLRKAKIASVHGKYQEAVEYLEKLLLSYHEDILADNALFMMAELYDKQLGNSQKAMDLYKELLSDFPGSLYVVDARKRYRALRGDTVQ